MNDLEKRILSLSWKNHLSHIGSCLCVLPTLEKIYQIKNRKDKVVLDCGHAHIAHLVCEEKYEGKKIGKIHDIHCNKKDGCIPTGSLGQGLSISVGLALADRSHDVYVIVSDGGMNEGSNWEALRIADELELDNLKIYCVSNGFAAYKKMDADLLEARINMFNPRVKFVRVKLPNWDFITDDQEYHYKVLNKEEYAQIIR